MPEQPQLKDLNAEKRKFQPRRKFRYFRVQKEGQDGQPVKNTSVFLRSSQGKNKSEGRAIRMPKKDLLDLLFRLFEEYEYWSMKGLKERTRQPSRT
ncbi:hypothetical protein Cantr_03483 [Candida viswanathii]|uniref:TFIIF beta subunit HTH domain-containing protein n=1 Tax=Candida viswanathii TaxID=5486 RepID=A0A367YMX4_9ASCO|nr:hypothetical protein Cantr_03483 [Candida viswanathii]